MNPLSLFIAWRSRRKARKALEAAERQRAALIAQIADRKARHDQWVPKIGELQQATEASLRAYVAGGA